MNCISIESMTEHQRNELLTGNNLYYYKERSKIIQINGIPIGFYTPHILFDKLTLEFNLFERYRKLGLGYAFVNIVTEMVASEYLEYDSIYLLIRSDNVASLTVAFQNGYVQSYNDDLRQMIDEEMPNYLIYYKQNEFYKNALKNKHLLHKL